MHCAVPAGESAAAQPLKHDSDTSGDAADTSDDEAAELQELLQQMRDPAVRQGTHRSSKCSCANTAWCTVKMPLFSALSRFCCRALCVSIGPMQTQSCNGLTKLPFCRVELIIKLLGLQRCADTVVGNAGKPLTNWVVQSCGAST